MFLFRLHLGPFSAVQPDEKMGQFPPTSQSERRSGERGGAYGLRSRKKYKIPDCRNNAFLHNFVKHRLPEPSKWLTEERKRPIRWSSGRRVVAIRWVDIYVQSCCCAALSRLEYLGEGSWKVQYREISPIMSDFSSEPQPTVVNMNPPVQPNTVACLLYLIMLQCRFLWLVANLLSLIAKDTKQTPVLVSFSMFPGLNMQRFQSICIWRGSGSLCRYLLNFNPELYNKHAAHS